MEGQQGTIEEAVDGVTAYTYARRVDFHRVTKDEMENLMSTSLEFQICTGLTTLALGAFLSGCFSQLDTLTENVIYSSSIPIGLMCGIASLYFYLKMKKEKKRYFDKFVDEASSDEPSKEDLQQMINDLLTQVYSLQGRR